MTRAYTRHVPYHYRHTNIMPPYNLSRREYDVLVLLYEGESMGKIGELLTISQDTAWVHIRHIYKKLNVHSKCQAVIKYYRYAEAYCAGHDRAAPYLSIPREGV